MESMPALGKRIVESCEGCKGDERDILPRVDGVANVRDAPSSLTTPLPKAPRLGKRASPSSAMLSNHDHLNKTITPGGSATTQPASPASESSSMAESAEAKAKVDAEVGSPEVGDGDMIDGEIIDDGRFDPVDALREYDEKMSALAGPTDPDPEEEEMDAADARRRKRDQSDPTSDGWNVNFKTAVHEAGRRLLARCFQGDQTIEHAMKMCFSKDQTQTDEILAEFDAPSSLHISYKHVIGEALELLMCYLSRVETRVDLRDYLAEEQLRSKGGESRSVFVECRVHKCFMSSAPVGSPFRMTHKDYEGLAMAFGGSDTAWELAAKLYDQSLHDRFFDVLIIMKDLEHAERYHIRAIQCKARTQFDAFIDISKYVGHQFAMLRMASEVNALLRLDWVANVFSCKQAESDGDFAKLCNTGHLKPMLYEDLCLLESKIRLAAEMAKHAFGSREGEIVPQRHKKELRPFQKEALEALRVEREELKSNGGSFIAATGSGKSRIACEDAMATMYDQLGNPLTQRDQIGLVWACPRINLLGQSVETFREHESLELDNFAKRQSGFKVPKVFYYLVCSAKDKSDTADPNAIRRLTVPDVFSTLMHHESRGELGMCRFFTTIEGGSGFWHETCKYIRVSRGIDAPLDDRQNPLVNVFVVDEAHALRGNSGGMYQLTLNIPAKWRVCYTATPIVETHRVKTIDEQMDRMAELRDGDELDPFDEPRERTPKKGKKKAKGKMTPEERFPSEWFSKLADLGISEHDSRDPLDEVVDDDLGLAGCQLLSESLQFVSLECAASLPHLNSPDDLALIRQLQEIESCLPSTGPTVADFSESLGDRQVVIFETNEELHRGMCTCGSGINSQCAEDCAVNTFPDEDGPIDRFTCHFDNWHYRNFIAYDIPASLHDAKKHIFKSNCLVLGWNARKQALSIRLGDPRGFGCHDFTDFGVRNGTNLIGAPMFTYTYAEAFRAKILARPRVVIYQLRPPSVPMNQGRTDLFRTIFGIENETSSGKTTTCKSLTKVGLQFNFVGAESRPLAATTQDYFSAMMIYRMIEQNEARKIMVFCSNNEACRRCLALFQAVLRRRIQDAESRGDLALAERLKVVNAAHIYASWRRNGKNEYMGERVRRKLLHVFKMGEIEVLFNTDYLSTGIDIPCTDAVVLTASPNSTRATFQRWGRALRVVSSRPDKTGIIAFVTSDPRESTDDRTARCKFMGLDSKKKKDFGGCDPKFRDMYHVVECATHPSNRIICETESVKVGRTTIRKQSSQGAVTKQSSTFPPIVDTVTPSDEKILCDMFDITVRDLLDEP